MKSRPVVIFAQVPPPEHGQSRMVAAMIEALEADPDAPCFTHIDARFSKSLTEIGEGSVVKVMLCFRYLWEALRVRFRLEDPVLYYVPGPVKWSAVGRDWLLLVVLRFAFSRIVFHWHAIGQGEWAHGSDRQRLPGPRWLESLGRRISRLLLAKPDLSIVVSENSRMDADVIGSREVKVVWNGIQDPADGPEDRKRERHTGPIRLLFLSHGTAAKGLPDLLEALVLLGQDTSLPRETGMELTLAGGVAPEIRDEVDVWIRQVEESWSGRLQVAETGFIDGEAKRAAFLDADLFLAPSRWESFGLTVAESMAFGVPVVATASDGVSGVLPEGYPYLSEIADPEGLAERLSAAARAVLDGSIRPLSEELRARFEECFRFERFGSSIVASLSFVAEDRQQGKRGHDEIAIYAYLADQNPKLGRSLGISRMTEVVLGTIAKQPDVALTGVVSRSSVRAPDASAGMVTLPWSTRPKPLRILTDHLHPVVMLPRRRADVWYFPKGFMPRFHLACQPAVATIHDTIIQYYQDHYPKWRLELEYSYWAGMLRNTLRNASAVMTVSENAKRQIEEFVRRHKLPEKKIYVTYEPCLYESIPQPEDPAKADYVLHLGSKEPHKRTAWLVRQWLKGERERVGSDPSLPKLHVVGALPDEVTESVRSSASIVYLPFLEDQALVSQFTAAKALVFPSEVEGFGLPAIEAYYLGTPVCYHRGTSVEEVLGVATDKGGFSLDDASSLWPVLEEVMALPPDEVRRTGLALRDAYSSKRVVERMMEVFGEVAGGGGGAHSDRPASGR
ncbi:hypothetical protein HAHE_22320 [Haloferula helveola]|uniref:Glycosyl transferase family 1 domain-containing protein n=1 Tax=Haloferula helveola TaxID=490095 RepID=A0ABM7RAD0_9BACT|nr:hypothetical protein HAHE_22320 [Haloferula helveola]